MKCTYLDMGSASGSLGGKVFSRNQYGSYIRTRAIPVNPNTGRQQFARAQFQDMAERWLAVLTDAQRTAWNLYGSSVTMIDKIGQSINLSGFSHYIRSNTARLRAGLLVIDAGPTVFTLAGGDGSFSATISEAAQLISVTFDDTKDWCSEDFGMMTIYMTSPQSPGREYLDIKLRSAGGIGGSVAAPAASPAVVGVPYAVVEDQKVIVKGRIGRADGRLSYFFQFTVTIAA